jgi:hypothetical protein
LITQASKPKSRGMSQAGTFCIIEPRNPPSFVYSRASISFPAPLLLLDSPNHPFTRVQSVVLMKASPFSSMRSSMPHSKLLSCFHPRIAFVKEHLLNMRSKLLLKAHQKLSVKKETNSPAPNPDHCVPKFTFQLRLDLAYPNRYSNIGSVDLSPKENLAIWPNAAAPQLRASLQCNPVTLYGGVLCSAPFRVLRV